MGFNYGPGEEAAAYANDRVSNINAKLEELERQVKEQGEKIEGVKKALLMLASAIETDELQYSEYIRTLI